MEGRLGGDPPSTCSLFGGLALHVLCCVALCCVENLPKGPSPLLRLFVCSDFVKHVVCFVGKLFHLTHPYRGSSPRPPLGNCFLEKSTCGF